MPHSAPPSPRAGRLRAGVAALCGVLALAGAAVPAAAAPPSGAVLLLYHRFGESRYPATNIRLEQFEHHLAVLRRPEYRVLPVPEIVAALRQGRPLPKRTVGITIDDAYASVYTEAWPRLRRAGLPFTVFVATDPVDRGFRDMMSWDQLRKMVLGGGVTIGHHTAGHLHMPDHDEARNRAELAQAGERLAAELHGWRPTLFAYPYGEYSLAVRRLVEGGGFAAAFGQHSGVAWAGEDRFALPRFALNEHYGAPERFDLVVEALPLPVSDVSPAEVLLDGAPNPPRLAFTVGDAVERLAELRCYGSGRGAIPLHRAGRRVEVRPEAPFGAGRTRINCTAPGPEGRWHWWGRQFYRPDAPGPGAAPRGSP